MFLCRKIRVAYIRPFGRNYSFAQVHNKVLFVIANFIANINDSRQRRLWCGKTWSEWRGSIVENAQHGSFISIDHNRSPNVWWKCTKHSMAMKQNLGISSDRSSEWVGLLKTIRKWSCSKYIYMYDLIKPAISSVQNPTCSFLQGYGLKTCKLNCTISQSVPSGTQGRCNLRRQWEWKEASWFCGKHRFVCYIVSK